MEGDHHLTRHAGLLLSDLGQLLLVQLVALQAVLVLHVQSGHLVVRMRGHAPRHAHLAVNGVVHLVTEAAHPPAPGLGSSLSEYRVLLQTKGVT